MKTIAMTVLTAGLLFTGCSKDEVINPLLGTYKVATYDTKINDVTVSNDYYADVLLTITGDMINATSNANNESKAYTAESGKLKITGGMNKVLYLSAVQDYRVTQDSLIISNVKINQSSITYRLVRK
ncbi:hypothetical protein [Sphingobacterium multivorum]|uniref:hypothetical protein n=1 Tax=Sphingobacterium multivorum TaxID=28454 RepID=UPI0028B22AC1|nr:hypothetical protein [Sphingobacterium multivorum]